jgi:uncharacterized phosphatase
MFICILRHGETDWNTFGKLHGREDIPLNSTGIEQIIETTKYLCKYNWNVIITSPLSRAKQSAEIIVKELGNIKILEDIDLVERDYGKASGMTAEERKLHFPNGIYVEGVEVEPYETLQSRMVNALIKYSVEYKASNILIVSHGGAINSVLAHLSKNEIGTGKTTLKNACITLLEKIEDEIKIVYYNKTANELI